MNRLILSVPQTRERLVRRVCPLFSEPAPRDALKSPKLVGSAVLFRYNQCSVLLTAKHVCDAGNGSSLMVRAPGATSDSTSFVRLPFSAKPWKVRATGFDEADVVCIPLHMKTADWVGQMCQYVEPYELGSVDEEEAELESRYLLFGFPHSKNKQATLDPRTGLARKAWGNTAFIGELRRRLPQKFATIGGRASHAHFALEASKKMSTFSGGVRDAPDLRGMSGGGIWKVLVDPQTQMVEKCSLVGLLIEREIIGGKVVLRAVRTDWAGDYRKWYCEEQS